MGPYELLQRIVEVLERLHIPYLVTGSVAAMAYGEPRLTNDIDIVAAVKEGHISELISAFPESEFYISADMIRDAIRHRSQFNIIHPSSGLKVDIIIPGESAFDKSGFGRVRRISPSESYQANFASPEDVIIIKMECYRDGGSEKHLRDITGIMMISGSTIDEDYISDWANKLGIIEIWEAVKKRIGKS